MGTFVISINAPGSLEVDILVAGKKVRARIDAIAPASKPDEPDTPPVIVGPITSAGIVADGIPLDGAEDLTSDVWKPKTGDSSTLQLDVETSGVQIAYLRDADDETDRG